MSDLIERLHDLHKQATTERSHYYVAKCCRDSIDEIERLRRELAEARGLLERVNAEIQGGPLAAPGTDRVSDLVRDVRAFLGGEKPPINDCIVVGDGYCTTHKQDAFMCGPGKGFRWKEFAPTTEPDDSGKEGDQSPG